MCVRSYRSVAATEFEFSLHALWNPDKNHSAGVEDFSTNINKTFTSAKHLSGCILKNDE